jgi:hypothetical protein
MAALPRLTRSLDLDPEDIRFLGGATYSFQDGDEVLLVPSIAGDAIVGSHSQIPASRKNATSTG